jgi:hypothetical protein
VGLDDDPLVTHLLEGHRVLGNVVVLPSIGIAFIRQT